jgi:hypothetical protein
MAVDISGTYPQAAPIIALTPIKGKTFVTSKLCDQLLQEVNELAEQNVGMPSIYLLAQHVQVSNDVDSIGACSTTNTHPLLTRNTCLI